MSHTEAAMQWLQVGAVCVGEPSGDRWFRYLRWYRAALVLAPTASCRPKAARRRSRG